MKSPALAFFLFLATSPFVAEQTITLTPPGALDWATTPQGVAFAPLHGDRTKGAYFAMVRLPAGTISPTHQKSAAMIGLMIEGEMTHNTPGTDSAPIGPGSYYEIPANLPHVSACVSDNDCVTLLYQDGAFDFRPVQP